MNLDLFRDGAGAGEGEARDDASAATPEPHDPVHGGPDADGPTGSASEPPALRPETPAPGDEPTVWSVSQVNRAVRTLLEETLPPIWVGGEVANWTRARSGHRYFTLKDENAQLDCVMWRSDAEGLPTDPDEGMMVRAHGTLTIYETRGRYQMVVGRLEGEGAEGLWRLAFEKLRKKLDEEGLLAPERKRPLPRFPGRVGVVTSTTGAALRDILTVVRRRAPWTRVVVRGTRVQGEGAAEEIAGAIRVLGGSGRVDVVIAGRGGGSIEDLWAFNEEVVARAIAECPVPVVSAVGHEVDVTIADLVADARAPTPSAAAEAVVPDSSALRETLRRVRPRLAGGLRRALEIRRRTVEEGLRRLARAVDGLLEPRRQRVGRAGERLARAIGAGIERRRQRLARLAGKVEALSPLSTLRRGYAVPLTEEGEVLRRVAHFEPGREFVLRVVDGRVACRAEETTEEEAIGA